MIAVGLAAMLLGTALAGEHPATDFDALGYALVVASGLALAAGRRAPVPVLVVTALCSVGYQAAGFDVPPSRTCSRCTRPSGQGTVSSPWR